MLEERQKIQGKNIGNIYSFPPFPCAKVLSMFIVQEGTREESENVNTRQ